LAGISVSDNWFYSDRGGFKTSNGDEISLLITDPRSRPNIGVSHSSKRYDFSCKELEDSGNLTFSSNVLFSNNQTQLGSGNQSSIAQLICVCGDIGFLGNWGRVLGKDGIKINTMLYSNTLRASGNRLEEAKNGAGGYNDFASPKDYSDSAKIQISGTVTDGQTGNPLPGLIIVVKGTTTGTTTDSYGNYSIEAPSNATLVFRFAGIPSREVHIRGRTTIDVEMQPEVDYSSSKISLFTRSEKMNHTTDNQGNHCIIARNNSDNHYLIDRDNLVLFFKDQCDSLEKYL
jgi:hypothetical protein